MPNITFHFETDGNVNADLLAKEVQEKMSALPSVESANAEVRATRSLDPATIVSIITLAATGVTALNKLISGITDVIHSTQGLKAAIVEIDGEKVPVSQLTSADLQEAAK